MTPDCCEHWPLLKTAFRWFVVEVPERKLVMPSLRARNGQLLRVNHCPVCGSARRDAEALVDGEVLR